MTATATHAQIRQADNAEVVMLAYWRTCLERGTSPALVAGMIAAAVDFEPLLGLPMDVCNLPSCHVWAAEAARDRDGYLYCSPECQEAHDTLNEQQRERWAS